MSLNSDNEARITARVVGVIRKEIGLHERFAVPIAKRILETMSEEFQGERLYFACARRPTTIKERNAAVVADLKSKLGPDFDRTQRKALCKRHGISERTLYRILGNRRNSHIALSE